ncbi:MAG: orotidine 5'-phosphate decarboxylase, partial [Bacteroidota bacterium]
PGSADFQLFPSGEQPLYAEVIRKSRQWAGPDQLMFVVGATHSDQIGTIRSLAPDNFFLVPGVGAQGGSLEEVMEKGMNADCGLLINASRSIIYASSGEDFEEAARAEAMRMQQVMDRYLTAAGR